MTLENSKGAIVTFYPTFVYISRRTNAMNYETFTLNISKDDNWGETINKVRKLVEMDNELFCDMCRIAKL